MSASRPSKLSDRVYARIFEQIVNGHYREGMRLPSEASLAEACSVSRPIVREALARLRDDGLIRSHKGAGSFVERQPDKAMLSFAPVESVADIQRCFEFRAALEAESAALAAARADPGAFEEIERAVELLKERIAAREVGVDADFAFHVAVAKASGNRFFVDTLLALREQITLGQNLARNLGLRHPTTRLLEVQREHEGICESIRDGDAEAARRRMQAHISRSRRRVFEG